MALLLTVSILLTSSVMESVIGKYDGANSGGAKSTDSKAMSSSDSNSSYEPDDKSFDSRKSTGVKPDRQFIGDIKMDDSKSSDTVTVGAKPIKSDSSKSRKKSSETVSNGNLSDGAKSGSTGPGRDDDKKTDDTVPFDTSSEDTKFNETKPSSTVSDDSSFFDTKSEDIAFANVLISDEQLSPEVDTIGKTSPNGSYNRITFHPGNATITRYCRVKKNEIFSYMFLDLKMSYVINYIVIASSSPPPSKPLIPISIIISGKHGHAKTIRTVNIFQSPYNISARKNIGRYVIFKFANNGSTLCQVDIFGSNFIFHVFKVVID